MLEQHAYHAYHSKATHSRRRSDLKYSGSTDHPVFLDSLLSNGDSSYSCETLFQILGTPEKMCLICTGTPLKTCWKFGQSQLFWIRPPLSVGTHMTAKQHACHCKVSNCNSQESGIHWFNIVFPTLFENFGVSASCSSNRRVSARVASFVTASKSYEVKVSKVSSS